MGATNGQRVLLTGGSSGIGQALALELGGRGACLAIVARREDRLQAVADAVVAGGGVRPLVIVADLGERGTAERVARDALDRLGGLDVLVNNAGGAVGGTQVMVSDGDEAREAFELNFWSPVALAAAAVPVMRSQGGGVIVNVTSMAQVMTWPMLGHYAATKAALAQVTETLRLELRGTGVRVIEVIPGPVQTAMQGESRLVPGMGHALDSSPMGEPTTLAKKIVRAIDRPRSRVVYPTPLVLAYLLPAMTRRYMARLARRARDEIDVDDPRVMRSGSFGDPEARQAREAWEASHATPAGPPAVSGTGGGR